MNEYRDIETSEILNNSVFKFLKLIEDMPEEIILMGPPAIFTWLKENTNDPTLLASLEQIFKEHPELHI